MPRARASQSVMTRGLPGHLIAETRRLRWFVAGATTGRLVLYSPATTRSRLGKGPPGRPDDQRTEPTSQERSREQTDQEPTSHCPHNRAGGHGQDRLAQRLPLVRPEPGKASNTNDDDWEADDETRGSGGLDVEAVGEDERRNEQCATGDAEQAADDSNRQSQGEPGHQLQGYGLRDHGWHARREERGTQEHQTDQQEQSEDTLRKSRFRL